MSVVLPQFSSKLDTQTYNRYLQTYRRWARHQRQHGKPVTCWCLYLWISGNHRRGISASRLPIQRPKECKRSIWQGWLHHRRENGRLSFPEYMARYEKRSKAGQGKRSDLLGSPPPRKRPVKASTVPDDAEDVPLPAEPPTPPQFAKCVALKGDEGLRMEPSAVVAKINRILAAQGIGRRYL